jgi:hypothetical protein
VLDQSSVWIPPSRPKANEEYKSAFSCSKCRVYGRHTWRALFDKRGYGEDVTFEPYLSFATSTCFHCDHVMLWLGDRILYPETISVEFPNPDLPPDVQETYIEAGSIIDKSPRAAAALMRLAVQQLCITLGETGSLDGAIGNLVQRGLRREIQQALDVVRVVGNNAVHPGEIDLRDDRNTASAMFALVNAIGHELISRPKEVEALYGRLPETVRDSIERRDAPKEEPRSAGTD